MATQEDKKIERANAGKVMRLFARELKQMGFTRKSTFFSRDAGPIVQFLHVHKFSFAPSFRVHVCIRVLNDSRPYLGLLGITSDEYPGFDSCLNYGESPDSHEQCKNMLMRFICEVAEPWFKQQTPDALLQESSILPFEERTALQAALNRNANTHNVQLTRSLLGLV